MVIRRLIRSVLEDEGYIVDLAEDNARAVLCMEQHEPDLVVLDLFLPGTNGREVIDFWRRRTTASGLPVVVISSAPQAARLARQIRARAFLAKPFELDALLRAVAEGLRRTGDSLPEGQLHDSQDYVGWQPS